MKVVIFCGGMGMRLREAGDDVPKPMVPIGYRPILWHLMKYYAHFGHKDFILCLGYRADAIKRYFLAYEETISNDFVLAGGGPDSEQLLTRGSGLRVELMNRDIQDWRITFADTGINANIGQRLRAVQKYLVGEDAFLANYADGLSDLDLASCINRFVAGGKVGNFVSVRPNLSYHTVVAESDGIVREIKPMMDTDLRVNGGFFLFKREIFDYMQGSEELVLEPFQRLIAAGQLSSYAHPGFFASMDTFKDKQHMDDLERTGHAPWQVWRSNGKETTP